MIYNDTREAFVVIHFIAFSSDKGVKNSMITQGRRNKMRKAAVGKMIGDYNGIIFNVGSIEDVYEFSILFYNRQTAASFLWKARSMRRQKWWKPNWLYASWIRWVTCVPQTLIVTVKSHHQTFQVCVSRDEETKKSAKDLRQRKRSKTC